MCVDPTNVPVHARPVLRNLSDGKFEKLSFLTGILRGLLSKRAQVTKASRAGSIFMLPVYTSIMVFVGSNRGEEFSEWHGLIGVVLAISMTVLIARALFQLLALPFRSTSSHALFGLVVVDTDGGRVTILTLARRWLIVWLPLMIALLIAFWMTQSGGDPFALLLVSLLLWIAAAVYAVVHPNRGLHDQLMGTWVVRR